MEMAPRERALLDYYMETGHAGPIILLLSVGLLVYFCYLVARRPSARDLILYFSTALLPTLIGLLEIAWEVTR